MIAGHNGNAAISDALPKGLLVFGTADWGVVFGIGTQAQVVTFIEEQIVRAGFRRHIHTITLVTTYHLQRLGGA